MSKITADKIGSSTGPCRLGRTVELSSYIVTEEGYCLAVRALDEKEVYNQIETTDGVFETIHAGDVLIGALGERKALKGYSGRIPRRVQVGDVLNVLNMGGIIGQCTSDHPDLGPALRVEVLGAVLTEQQGQKLHARLADHALEPVYSLEHSAPLVMVSGTSMNTGKTYACGQIVKALTARGLHVAAAKLTGASLMRDARVMRENGAIACATFTDAGVVCSTSKDMAPSAKAIIRHLNQFEPDVIVIELGDGFIGYYGVDDLLLDKELQRFTKAHVVAATDLAGAWAADQIFRSRYRVEISSFTGPVTDNDVGKQYIRNTFGTEALNAMQDADALGNVVAKTITGAGNGYARWSATG
ncbi:MAG TPA: hypothetical protein VFG50_06330 [Rhodothermales bacterium]|nr:hypothetical protein [Rhodothermales bacterium]